jgi:acetamidase/formamidase
VDHAGLFGCTEGWFGKRFAHALTGFLNGERARNERAATDALDAPNLQQRYEQHRANESHDANADTNVSAGDNDSGGPSTTLGMTREGMSGSRTPLGRVWTIPSNSETVDLGRFDPARPPIVTIASGDVVVYENTWTHFLNRLQPGVTIEELGALRKANPGRGVHSIVGPIAVTGAEPGDLLEIRFLALRTTDFGANFHNAAEIHTGSLPDEFEHGHIHYFDLNARDGYVEFNDRIKLELRPFQGTFGVAHESGVAVSSVAPGQHAGNIDVKELTAGSTLFIPVWVPGGLMFTGDSHALQGDGEVNITALETAMEEVRIQVILHKRAGYAWPMIETPTHWLMLGMHESLNEALRISLRNTIDFLAAKAQLTRADAYGLASLAVDFRVSQMVDVNNGIHAMIPKSIFAPDFRKTMSIV